MLAAGCVIVPLYHSTTQADAFALPKAQAMWVLVALAAIAAVLGATAKTRRIKIPFDLTTWTAFTLAALVAASWVVSVDRSVSLGGERLQWQGLLALLSYLALFLLARSVNEKSGGARSAPRSASTTSGSPRW